MISHLNIAVKDLARSKEFYERTLRPLGYRICFDNDDVVSFLGPQSADPAGDFWLSRGEPFGNHVACPHRKEDRLSDGTDAHRNIG